MFGHNKTDKLIENINRYFGLMDQAVLVFNSGVRNYLYSNTNDINNTKIRNGKMDIKTYVQTVDGLESVENINYLQAIKRVIGMSDKPLANE